MSEEIKQEEAKKEETSNKVQEETSNANAQEAKKEETSDAVEEKKEEVKEKKFEGVLEIMEKVDNPLLDREEIVAKVVSSITPSKEQVKKLLVNELKVSEELLKVKHVYSSYGSLEFKILADVYKNKDTFQKLEVKQKKVEEKKK